MRARGLLACEQVLCQPSGDLPSGFRTSSEPVAIQTTVVAGRLTGTLLATAVGHGGRTVLGNAGRGGRKSCLSIVYRQPRDAGSKRQESGDATVKDRQRDKAGSDGMGRGPRRAQQGWTATHQHQRDRRDLHLCTSKQHRRPHAGAWRRGLLLGQAVW